MSATISSRAHASHAVEPVHPILHVVESDPKAGQRRRAWDRAVLALMFVSTFLFTASMLKYVVSPAVTTVANSSIHSVDTNR